jgi:hypothetical protein
MKIIVLQGMPNKGKTTTLNKAWDILCKENGGNSTNRKQLGGDRNDFSDIVIFNEQCIAFFTMGDYSTALARAINNYLNQGCDVLIYALNINTLKVRANNAINQFPNARIDKLLSNNTLTEEQANESDARRIFNLL